MQAAGRVEKDKVVAELFRVGYARLGNLDRVALALLENGYVELRADGFLKQMVRNIAGMLVACGQGKLSPDAVPALLAAGDRRCLRSPTAPPQGLALARVAYPPGDGFSF